MCSFKENNVRLIFIKSGLITECLCTEGRGWRSDTDRVKTEGGETKSDCFPIHGKRDEVVKWENEVPSRGVMR
jgi:hypothetical protein